MHGAAMESPMSPSVANLFMKVLESKALNTAANPPRLWRSYVDDTSAIQERADRDQFLDDINSK